MNYETHNLIPFEWKVGDLILGKYEIREIFSGGGMGLVYRAYHREWNIDLAIKTPREDYFKTQDQIDAFKGEAERWISIGMHPNVTTCFYVQNLGLSPRLFAEFVEGGSLADWIASGRFNLLSEQERIRTILGVAIQFARGLDHAHNKGLIHQDVKPANVLMTPDGSPKVTDFGLASTRMPNIDKSGGNNSNQTIFVSGAGFLTEAYASPEQASGKPLSRKTDIWSWAVSILEILNGGRDWSHGQAAPFALEILYEDRIHTDPLACLLSDCFSWKPEDRPSDFSVVIQRLDEIHREIFGERFPQPIANLKSLSVDSLNNHAVSLIELGKGSGDGETGLSCLYELRKRDKLHSIGRLNLSLLEWRRGSISIQQMTTRLENLLARPESMGNIPEDWIVGYYNEVREYRKAIAFSNSILNISKAFSTLSSDAILRFRMELLNIFGNLNGAFRNKTITKYGIPADELSYAWIESSCPEYGIVGYYNHSLELVVSDIHFGSVLLRSKFHNLHHIRAFAISEMGRVLLVLMDVIADNVNKNSTDIPFQLSLFYLTTGIRVELPNNFKLPSGYCEKCKLTVTDDGRSASIWIPRENGWTTVDYEFSVDSGEWRCYYDFRKYNAVLPGAEIIRTSAYGSRLIAVLGSRLQFWETQQTQINHCILDIDLRDFGIIDTRDHLPNFSLETGWEFEIDQWNIFDILRAVRQLQTEQRAPYIIVQPPTWRKTLEQWQDLQKTLKDIEVVESSGNVRMLIEGIDHCLALGISEKAELREKRHAIVRGANDCFLFGAWIEESVDQYWESEIVGIRSEFRDLFTFMQSRRLSRFEASESTSGSGRLLSDCGFLTRGTEYKRCFGIAFFDSDRSLYLMQGERHSCCKIALVEGGVSNESRVIADWDVNLNFGRSQIPAGVQLRNEFTWLECVQSRIFYRDGLRSFAIRDGFTGIEVGSVMVDDEISMLKRVVFGGIECIAVGTTTLGVVYVYDQNGHLEHVIDANHGLGGFIEDISYYCSDAIIMAKNHSWVHVNLLERSINIVSNSYCMDRNRFGRIGNHRYRLSHCGKAVVGDDRYSAWVIDLRSGREILRWAPPSPWVLQAAPCFDVSGRWLIMPHSINRYDLFQLLWNIEK